MFTKHGLARAALGYDPARMFTGAPDAQGGAGGGGGTSTAGTAATGGTTASQGTSGVASAQAGTSTAAGASTEQQSDKGFPENTPVAEMNDRQQAAYWKFQSRKHEGRVNERSDYDDLKTKAAAWEKHQAENASELEKAVAAARAEGESTATVKANTAAVLSILTASLGMRGKDEQAVKDLIAAANPAAFITDGTVDTDKVSRYVDQIAGPATGQRRLDMGQGVRPTSQSSGVNAGKDLYTSSRGKKSA